MHEKEPEFGKKEDVIEVYGRLMKHYERYSDLHLVDNSVLTAMFDKSINLKNH